jgi:serine/threonine protein kinase
VALSGDDPRSVGGYKLVDRLGIGGMGVVYLARSRSGREVAVKVVHAQYAQDQVFRTRFRQEIEAVRKVSGAFTAPVVDADPEAVRPWMATQYVPGPSLADQVRGGGSLGGGELRRLALGLVEALHDIHRAGVVHRDLKPGNVLIAQDGPRVIDFGISRAAENQPLTETGHAIGTPPFMSPEQFTDSRSVGPASDVFSLGALLVFAATGRGPFDSDTPYMTAFQVMNEEPALDGVGEPLRGIVARCLAKTPDDRPELAELAKDFAALPEPAPGDMQTVTLRAGRGESSASGDSSGPGSGRSTVQPSVSVGPGSGQRRGKGRGRWSRPILAATVGALVLGLTAYFVHDWRVADADAKNANQAGPSTSLSPSPSASSRWPKPSGDWRPWQTTVGETAAVGPAKMSSSVSSEEGTDCVASGGAVYCGGTNVLPVRIDAMTGRTVWRAGPGVSLAENTWYSTQVQAVRDGSVLVMESVTGASTGDASSLVALDPKTGRRIWHHKASDGSNQATLTGQLVVTTDPGERSATAWSTRTGAKQWTVTWPTGYVCDPFESAGALYADCQRESAGGSTLLLVLDPADGTFRRLTAPSTGSMRGTLDGRLLFLDWRTSETGSALEDMIYTRIVRFDPETGTHTTTKFAGKRQGEATLLDGTLYFVRSNGEVTAVSPKTGKQVWQTRMSLENPGRPVLDASGRTLYLASGSGRLAALDARTGEGLWESLPRARVVASGDTGTEVMLGKGALIAATADGTVFTLDPGHPAREAVPAASVS